MTVTWHVDDLKISHVDPYQITKFCHTLHLSMAMVLWYIKVKVHEYLGMGLNFALDGIVQVLLIAFTTKVITNFPKSITTSCTSLASNHLFTVQEALEAKFLPKEKAHVFTTLWHNPYSSANSHAGIFKPPSPS
jgi:hypothetical protein